MYFTDIHIQRETSNERKQDEYTFSQGKRPNFQKK